MMGNIIGAPNIGDFTPGTGVIIDPKEVINNDNIQKGDEDEARLQSMTEVHYTFALAKDSDLLIIPERVYGTIRRVGTLNTEPILYGDVNLLKLGQLYYISGAKQVYRYIKSEFVDEALTYYFDTIKTTSTDGLLVPEEERGKIHRAGELFGNVIYSGDPNLIDNGSLFYHDTLPYISTISNENNIVYLSTDELNSDGEVNTVWDEYNVNKINYDEDYLTFKVLKDTTSFAVRLTGSGATSLSYSVDSGKTWVTSTDVTIEGSSTYIEVTSPEVATGKKIKWKGNNSECIFSITKANSDFEVMGNIMSVFDEEDFEDNTEIHEDALLSAFYQLETLISAENLILPTTTNVACYMCMFQDCTSLKTAPILPATTLSNECYKQMFQGCTSLTTAPELPATVLAQSCYRDMFTGCTSLTSAPDLPATQLAGSCYRSMFNGCTSLTTTPAFTATILTDSCYRDMFKNCTSITETTALPFTTLAINCYRGMFEGCTGITVSPELPALTLVDSCYSSMFKNCSNLKKIIAMFTTEPSSSYTASWVQGVAAEGLFVKNPDAEWDVTGNNGVPTGWTVVTPIS